MNKIGLSLIALAVTGSLSAQAAEIGAVDFSGYFRAGTGVNSRGGTMTCFQLPGADTKWRLGNECDYTIEPNLATTIAKTQDGSEWRVHFMPSVYRAYGQIENGTSELTTRFGQVYAYGRNVPQLNGGTVWAGRRFYNRLQLGINDQFLERNDGDGAGVEDINVGIGKFSAAFMMSGLDSDVNDNRFALPLRLTDIKTGKDSSLSVYATYEGQSRSEDQNTNTSPNGQPSGHALGIYHRAKGWIGEGETLIGARYDKNNTARGAVDQKNTRLVIQQTGKMLRATDWDVIGEVRWRNEKAAGDSTWYSLGGRTDTHISGPFRFLVELGHDIVKPDNGETRNLTKLTLAGAISAGNEAGSRPTFRVFYTYARWNDAAKAVLGTGWVNESRAKEVFGNSNSGSSIGVQAEAWW
ncbi:MAG: carbohydrate porin [Moraxellaceae bacterium]|nr:carbohydrate porin [Moraxellaceae bacterium]